MENRSNIFITLIGILAFIFVLASCSEPLEIKTRSMDRIYLVVEAMLTDKADLDQCVILSESVDYFSEEEIPDVSGAEVSVTDGLSRVVFSEDPSKPGTYRAPSGFACRRGREYTLSVDAVVDGENRHCEASAKMSERTFQIDSINYVYSTLMDNADSLWTIYIWGSDRTGDDYYLVRTGVNGLYRPIEGTLSMDDKYFDGQKVKGFPIAILSQSARHQKMYGECAKFLETGDELTLLIYSLTKDTYDFLTAFASNSSAGSIPMFSSQPANCPTNIVGEDCMGYFSVSRVSTCSRTVDDPLRTELPSKYN